MSFQKSAYSLRSRFHFGEVKPPVVAGIAIVVFAVVIAVAFSMISLARSQSFQITHEQDIPSQDGASAQVEDDAARVFVHVAGCVASPGVYELDEGARVADAVAAAGGFAEGADESSLNLARIVTDGEQITVASLPVEGVEDAPSVASGGKVNINTAEVDELMTLDGVGEATAKRIVEDRRANGPFATVEDLKRVSGIGDKKYAALADGICV